jgi:hypothetical protein
MSSIKSFQTGSGCGWYLNMFKLLGVALAVLVLCVPAFSQGNLGRIMGTVTDASGGVVAGATVNVIDVDRGITRTLTSDDAGEYNAPNLTPGNYTVRTEAKGFKKLERQNVDLGVGKEVRVDVVLQPGEQVQTVTVTEAVPLVETTNATLGGTLDNTDIVDMPLNGRNYQMLLGLRPGVMVQPGGGPWTQSTNGVRPDESVWLVDGVINSNFFDSRPIAGMSSPITDAATILPIDSIQEFNTMENPKAEYGWKPGAVVNVGLKSGTNQLHGSAYGFYRSAAWDARNFFNPGLTGGNCLLGAATLCAKLPTQLKQFGGSVGGPIKKDKLFFFANYEGLRDLLGNALLGTGGIPETVTQTTPNPATSMVDAINALVAAHVTVSPVSLKLGGCTVGATPSATACTGLPFFPVNTNTNGAAGTAFISTLPNTNDSNNGVAKIDYHINDKNTLNGLFIVSNYLGTGEDHPFAAAIYLNNFNIRNYTAEGNWDYTPSSSMVNEVRFGYDRMQYSITDDDQGITDPLSTGLSATGLPNIYITGLNFLGSWHNRPQSESPNPYEDFQDAFSYLHGKHSLKFGYEYTHIEADSNVPNYGRGRVNFKGGQTLGLTDCTVKSKPASCPLEDFFAGNPDGGTVLVGNNSRSMHWSNNAIFGQDDWRLTPKLTVNVGMRWSYVSPITAAGNLWANFDPASQTGLAQQGTPGYGTMWKPDYRDFSPRVGFAWDVTGKGTTVVRGAFSIMYSAFSAVQWMNQNDFQNDNSVTLAANPTGAEFACTLCATPVNISAPGNIVVKAASVNPTNAGWNGTGGATLFSSNSISCTDNGGQCDIMGVDPNLRTPYVMNYNIGIQHQFGNNYSLEVGYVGNRGERLVGFQDVNQANPATGVNPYATQFPWFGFINVMSNFVHSNYNGLQATFTKRLSHGLSFIAGYTYSHALDNGSLNRFGLIPQNSLNTAAEYASSDFDVRNRFTLTATYNIPGIKGYGQLLEGWQINAIVNLQSPQPWTINDTNDNFAVNNPNDFNGGANGELTYRWNFSGDPSNFRSGVNSLPFCSGPTNCVQTSAQYANGVVISNYTPTQEASMWAQCVTADNNAPGANLPSNLSSLGCFVNGNAVMTPPHQGTFGDMGRNIFRDSGFRDLDFSLFKNFSWRERYNAQLRLEVFNILNHPIPANPYGASNGFNTGNDPSAGAGFGGSPSTPDGAAGNPIVGSGSARDVQIGLKITF